MRKVLPYLITCILLQLFTSCSVTKNLDEGQQVLVETNVHFTNPGLIEKEKKVAPEMIALVRPIPATGYRKFQTNRYNSANKMKKEKGFRKFLARKIGKPPVLYDHKIAEKCRLLLQKYMHDIGYLGSTVTFDTVQNNQAISIDYAVTSRGRYSIQNIFWPKAPKRLSGTVRSVKAKSVLKQGAPYQLMTLNEERSRLANAANNSGFMNVNQDHFYYFIDTTFNDHKVDVYIKIQQEQDSTTYQSYRLNKVVVYPNYSLTSRNENLDTLQIDHLTFIQDRKMVNPKLLTEIIAGNQNDLYSKKKQDASLARLTSLGVFKFVNLRYEQFEKDSTYYFDKIISLTPGLMQDVTSEFELSTRTGSLGIGASLNYAHKNIFRGAERLDVNITGSLEPQISTSQNPVNTTNFGIQSSIQFPKFLTPTKTRRNSLGIIPKTKIGIGYNYQNRTDFYSISANNFRFGYEWNELADRKHSVYPINVDQINVFNISRGFADSLANDTRLRRSFEDVFILGLKYGFEYNSLKLNTTQPYSFFKTGLETSGNLPFLVSTLTNKNGNLPYGVFSTPYAQFAWLNADYRHYIPKKESLWAFRLYGGIGVPYGNSDVLPYVKQFFSGGSTSVRSYRIRALGPGGFEQTEAVDSDFFFDQTGDIKLEGSVEYRFPILGYLKGALFADAGNIWLLNNVADRPEGIFRFSEFYKQIAIGTGFGLRVDFDYVVIRFDAAFPIRQNFITENGSQWNISNIDFLSKTWRQEDLVFHFAIGYPF